MNSVDTCWIQFVFTNAHYLHRFGSHFVYFILYFDTLKKSMKKSTTVISKTFAIFEFMNLLISEIYLVLPYASFKIHCGLNDIHAA